MLKKHTVNTLEEVRQLITAGQHRYIFSSVGPDESKIRSLFTDEDLLVLNASTPLPITLDYLTPQTLGLDRIAVAVGAHLQYPGNVLVIDAGTCVTYEIVDEAGIYKGGVIAPGLIMRMKAMAHFTRQLPDISEEWRNIPNENPGKSTRECLVNGALRGMTHEIQGYIDQFTEEYDQLSVILTGGDAPHFESNLKAPIFANFDLVLTGLNGILNYNT